jgi:hypothetical protein
MLSVISEPCSTSAIQWRSALKLIKVTQHFSFIYIRFFSNRFQYLFFEFHLLKLHEEELLYPLITCKSFSRKVKVTFIFSITTSPNPDFVRESLMTFSSAIVNGPEIPLGATGFMSFLNHCINDQLPQIVIIFDYLLSLILGCLSNMTPSSFRNYHSRYYNIGDLKYFYCNSHLTYRPSSPSNRISWYPCDNPYYY